MIRSLATDRIVQHVWGLRSIDDLVLSREDENADGDYDDAGDSTRYALTDHQFSVIALISDTGTLLERVTYTPYGEARHQWREDVNGDGPVDSADYSAASGGRGSIWQSSYNVDADFDRDGDVDTADLAQISTPSYKSARAPGVLSASSVGNTIGFCGYVFNPEIGGSGIYTVRFRHYDPALGRWLERDPAGYVDSMSLYGYGWGNPTDMVDPLGLARLSRDPDEDRRLKRDIPGFREVYEPRARYAKHVRERLLEPLHDITVTVWAGVGAVVLLSLTPGVPDEAGLLALVLRNARAGRALEAQVVALLERMGLRVIGTQVAIWTPFGWRIIDIVIQIGDAYYGVEVKRNLDSRPKGQPAKDRWINSGGPNRPGPKGTGLGMRRGLRGVVRMCLRGIR